MELGGVEEAFDSGALDPSSACLIGSEGFSSLERSNKGRAKERHCRPSDHPRVSVGGGALLLKRTVEGWTTVFDGGPTGNGNDLYGAAAADDSTRIVSGRRLRGGWGV